jgi:hypothetical protein
MAWIADGTGSRATASSDQDGGEAPGEGEPEPGEGPMMELPGARPRRGKAAWFALAAVVVVVVALAALWSFRPEWLGLGPRPSKVAVAQPKSTPPPPAATPAPPQPATPAPAEPTAAATPPPAPEMPAEPHRAGPRARFEPGTVTVGKVRKKATYHLARKDRKLLDLLSRKQDETAPPEPVEKLDLDSGRSIDQPAVVRVLTESQGAFSGCVTRATKSGGGLPASHRATLLLTVEASGAVSSAWVAEAEVARTGLGKCLATAGRRLVFPSFEGRPVDVSVPLTLEAR